MKQAGLNPNRSKKKTREQIILKQMEQVAPWAALVERGLLLKVGTVVHRTLMVAPSPIKKTDYKCNPGMHSSKKGEKCTFV